MSLKAASKPQLQKRRAAILDVVCTWVGLFGVGSEMRLVRLKLAVRILGRVTPSG